MATAITANDSTARIPAWKRLGLKLKWANDSTTSLDDNGRSPVCINGKGDEDGDPPSSKRRKMEESMKVNEEPVGTDLNTLSTKGDDVLESEECDATITYESEDGSEPRKTEANMEKKQKKERKKAKKKAEKRSTISHNMVDGQPESRLHEPAILSYLSTYHKQRAMWKYQKNKEIALFKNIFDLEMVPSSYNQALFSYLRGLKGGRARQRLVESAHESITADEQKAVPRQTDDEDGREYKAGITDYKAKLRVDGAQVLGSENSDLTKLPIGLRPRAEKRLRAEIILCAMGGDVPPVHTVDKTSSGSTSIPGGNNLGQPGEKPVWESKPAKQEKPHQQPRKKKRKNRTTVVEFSSSDSSSGSDD